MARTGRAEANGPVVLMTDGMHRHIGSDRLWRDAATFLDDVMNSDPETILLRSRDDPAVSGRSPDDATLLFIDPRAYRAAKCQRAPHERGPLIGEIRRRPTLPGRLHPSTIGAGGLNFRVRNGNGCDPAAIATETYCRAGEP